MKHYIQLYFEFVLNIYKSISNTTHKGIQGHSLLIGGSYCKMGSICLSSKAAIKSGCGLVTAFIPECGYNIVQISIPEVMVLTDISNKFITKIKFYFEH
jgi:NAD(P)H-hydrate repair Nnr-like enzyme with NAD(P)H-hydrate dehydratase domain